MFDQMNDINPVPAIIPQIESTGASILSLTVDRKDHESVTFVVATGVVVDVDATWDIVVQEGDTNVQSAHTPVADIDLIGTEALAGLEFTDDSVCKKIGYKGGKRYCSIEIDNVVANSGALPITAVAILGKPHSRPTANPPV